uniref:MFS domain-containing protein n=1 Tax=Panagrellus redivivus TaxID=6233 RepID=A0A7E4W1X2_PANRE
MSGRLSDEAFNQAFDDALFSGGLRKLALTTAETLLETDLDKPEPWQTWIIGLSIVTVSAIAAPLGMLLIPLLNKSLYDRFMVFLVALGVGAMSGSVLFILLPSAFALTAFSSLEYNTKSWLIIGALYGFFAVDRCLQFFLELRRRKCAKRKIHASTIGSVIRESRKRAKRFRRKQKKADMGKANDIPEGAEHEIPKSNEMQLSKQTDRPDHGHSHHSHHHSHHSAIHEKEREYLNNELEVEMITNNLVRQLSKRRHVAVVRVDPLDGIKYRTVEGEFLDMGSLRKDSMDSSTSNSTNTNSMTPASTVINMPEMSTDPSPVPKRSKEDPEMNLSVEISEKRVIDASVESVANVAYMIIFGSSANNFVDGMSTGAAFSDSLTKGISIGLAVISQQFPQELGTLAILVNSGLGLKRTLLFNLIPIVLSYCGFIVGVFLDNVNEGYDEYIYSISSGMYLYIFLGTLMPEIRDSLGDLFRTDMTEAVLRTVLQFSGMAFGVGFMYFMSTFGDE